MLGSANLANSALANVAFSNLALAKVALGSLALAIFALAHLAVASLALELGAVGCRRRPTAGLAVGVWQETKREYVEAGAERVQHRVLHVKAHLCQRPIPRFTTQAALDAQ